MGRGGSGGGVAGEDSPVEVLVVKNSSELETGSVLILCVRT